MFHWRKNKSWLNIKAKLATYFRKHKTKTDQFARIEIIVYENHIFKMKKMLKHNYVDIVCEWRKISETSEENNEHKENN